MLSALPPPFINSQPQPLCLPGMAFRSPGLAGGSILGCSELMEDTQPRVRHTAAAPDLFISTLGTLTSQLQRWPMTTLDAAALSGISTRGRGFQEQGSSSDCEDQGRLPREGGLGSRRRSSAATRSRSSHPLGLLESDLLLVTKRTNPVFS